MKTSEQNWDIGRNQVRDRVLSQARDQVTIPVRDRVYWQVWRQLEEENSENK